MSLGSRLLDALVTQCSAVRSDIWCFFAGALRGLFTLVCGMAASWKSGAWGQVKWLHESVIDWALSVANGIDKSCVILMVKAASPTLALKCSVLSALVDGGAVPPARPCPSKTLQCTVCFGGLPAIPRAEGCLERAKKSAFFLFFFCFQGKTILDQTFVCKAVAQCYLKTWSHHCETYGWMYAHTKGVYQDTCAQCLLCLWSCLYVQVVCCTLCARCT